MLELAIVKDYEELATTIMIGNRNINFRYLFPFEPRVSPLQNASVEAKKPPYAPIQQYSNKPHKFINQKH